MRCFQIGAAEQERVVKAPARRIPAAASRDMVAQVTRTFSRSPLIDPAVSILLLIAPNERSRLHKSAQSNGGFLRKTEAVVAAANIVDVPVFVSGHGVVRVPDLAPRRTFAGEPHTCIWKDDAFVKALDTENRSAIVIAGWWFDREVVAATLYAQANGYDVYVLADACLAQSREGARLAEARLFQVGATPLLAQHALHEWLLETSSSAQREALSALIK